MTIQDVQTIVGRVDVAHKKSPIAVFVTRDGLDCIFANTVEGSKRVARGVGLVDVFAGTHPLREARAILTKALGDCEAMKEKEVKKKKAAAKKKAKQEADEARLDGPPT